MRIPPSRTAGDVRLAGELMLQSTNKGALRCKLNGVCRPHHLLHPRRRFAKCHLARIVWKFIECQECALHLRRGVGLQDVDRYATALRFHELHTPLLELVPNRHHRVCILRATRGARRKSKFANRDLKLLA